MVTAVTVAAIGVEAGIGVAVGLAVLDRSRVSARSHAHIMGPIPGTTSWEPLDSGQPPADIPGVLVMLFASPLYFANAGQFQAQLHTALGHRPSRPQVLVLDVTGMHDIDFTGTRVLGNTLAELERQDIVFALARAGDHLIENLARSGLLQRIGADHLYPSVDEAVKALRRPEST